MKIEFAGLFDLQVNGFAGVDFNAANLHVEQVHAALTSLRRTGVTRCLPTLITSPFGGFAAAARVLARAAHPAIAGLHMEGPYISSENGPRGAHPREWILPPAIDDFRRRQEAADGQIALVTLAPEADGALDLIEYLVTNGVRVAIGHTAASAQQIADAVRAGATLATHLGNGCAETLPRHPNVIWELLAADDVYVSLIVDGHHLPPSTVKVMVRAKGAARTILISDAVACAGGTPGPYSIAGIDCVLGKDGRVSLPGTPYLAGSSLTLDRAIARTAAFSGRPIDDVIPMASTIPAAYIGRRTAGTVTAEWDADRCDLRILHVDGGQ
jgi:N-acetylglucosamine-6-phosphate deacetylase